MKFENRLKYFFLKCWLDLIIDIVSLDGDAILVEVLFQRSMVDVDNLLRTDVNLATLAEQELDDGLVRVRLGVVQRCVAVAVLSGKSKRKLDPP